jgi:hypothetical protein
MQADMPPAHLPLAAFCAWAVSGITIPKLATATAAAIAKRIDRIVALLPGSRGSRTDPDAHPRARVDSGVI